MKTILYLDDGVVTDSSKAQLEIFANVIQNDLNLCGLKVNEEKGVWELSQCLEWLGIEIDLESYVFRVPKPKIVKMCRLFEQYYNSPRLTARWAARATVILSRCLLYSAIRLVR